VLACFLSAVYAQGCTDAWRKSVSTQDYQLLPGVITAQKWGRT
jgi:hypothetical protein